MPFRKFSDDELIQLRNEFAQLITIEEKFCFWSERIRINYMWVGTDRVPKSGTTNHFIIFPKSGEETEEFNFHLLRQVRYQDSLLRTEKVIYEYDSLVSRLKEKLKDVVKQKPLLEDELKWIEQQVEKYKVLPATVDKDDYFFNLSLSKSWLKTFNDFYLKELEPDFSKEDHNYASILGTYSGCEIAKYKTYVERKIAEVENRQSPLSREEVSLKRQLLILYYTGYIDRLQHCKTDKERNKLLALLLNRSEQNVKNVLTYIGLSSKISASKTKDNLEFVLKALENAGLLKEAEVVKKELNTLEVAKQ